MLRFLLLAALALLGSSPALAQNTTALVVGTCGTVSIPFKAGNAGPLTVDTTGKLCSSASGGGGTPGGSNGQIQFNNAGAFGGGAGTAWDDTNRTLTIANAGATQSLLATYSELKFNRAGTVYLYNANADGTLQLGTTTAANGLTINSSGNVATYGPLTLGGTDAGISRLAAASLAIGNGTAGDTTGKLTLGSLYFDGATQSLLATSSELKFNRAGTAYLSNANVAGSLKVGIGNNVDGLTVNSDKTVTFYGSATLGNTLYVPDMLVNTNTGVIAIGTAGDVKMWRDAANTLALRHGVNAQALNVYNTWTDASNYEAIRIGWGSNIASITSTNAGTGTSRVLRVVGANGAAFGLGDTSAAVNFGISTSGHFLAGTDNTYDIGASAANRPRTGYFANAVVAANGFFAGTLSSAAKWNVGSADGVALVTNAGNTAGVSFDVSTDATVKFRNRANNADADITAGNITGSGYSAVTTFVQAGGASFFNWNGRARAYSPADGIVKVTQNSGSGYGVIVTASTTVANLPSAATAGDGARAFVTDSTVAATGNFGAAVVGGGANKVPVYAQGGVWYIG